MNAGSPSRSAIRSRIGTSAIGRLTELIADPALAVDRARDAEPDRPDLGAGVERGPRSSRSSVVEQLVLSSSPMLGSVDR